MSLNLSSCFENEVLKAMDEWLASLKLWSGSEK